MNTGIRSRLADVFAINNGFILVVVIRPRKTVQFLTLGGQNVWLHLPEESRFIGRF